MEEEKSYEDLSVGDITKAFFKGVYNATIGAAKNTLAMGRELATSSEARATLVEDIGNEIASIKENGVLDYSIKKVEDKWNEFSSASPEQQLEMLGELVPATATTITTLGSPQLIAGVKKIPADGSASKGLNGAVVDVAESMSARAAAYQSRITGLPAGKSYLLNGTKFDGLVNGVLTDAKGAGYATFVKDGQFRSWFRGADSLVSQAQRQLSVAGGNPIQWHFAEEAAATATRNLFQSRGISGIEVLFTP